MCNRAAPPMHAAVPRDEDDAALPAQAWRARAGARGTSVSWLCCWKARASTVREAWEWVESRCPARVVALIRKIARVVQRGGVTRFDVFCERQEVAVVIRALRARAQWHCREHVSWAERRKSCRRADAADGHAHGAADVVEAKINNDDDDDHHHRDGWQVAGGARARGARVAAAAAAPAAVGGGAVVVGAGGARSAVRVGTWNVRGANKCRDEILDFIVHENLQVMALQETLLREGAYALRLRGYTVAETHRANDGAQGLGVALLVHNRLAPSQTNVRERIKTPHVVWLRVDALWPGRAVYVASVYCKAGARVLQRVGRAARDFVRAGAEVMLLGDFNLTPDKAVKRLASVGFEGVLAQVVGSAATYHRSGVAKSAIDHIVCSPALAVLVGRCRVLRAQDRSDHWPLTAQLAATVEASAAGADRRRHHKHIPNHDEHDQQQQQRPKTNVAALTRDADTIHKFTHHNRFVALAAHGGDGDVGAAGGGADDAVGGDGGVRVEDALRVWSESVQVALTEAGAWGAPKPRSAHVAPRLSARAKRALRRRRTAFATARAIITQAAATRADRKRAWEAYRAARAEAFAVMRAECDRAFNRSVQARVTAAAASSATGRHQRALWSLLGELAQSRLHSRGNGATGVPVRDAQGQLHATGEACSAVWTAHFRALLGRVPPAAARALEAAARVPPVRAAGAAAAAAAAAGGGGGGGGADAYRSLRVSNDEFSVAELYAALRRIPAGKACGVDGVPADVLKLALPAPDADEGDPPSPFAAALLRVCNAVFTGEAATAGVAEWCAALIVPVYKAGDTTDTNNYRGIGLQTAAAKLVATMALARLVVAAERSGRVGRSQAGFRSREEAIMQVVSLQEAVMRRWLARQTTLLLFLDFRKAYDSVPHSTLFAKLEAMGLRGRMMSYIRRLHSEATAAVRVPGAPAAGAGVEFFDVRVGLVQGNPLSPLLFNLFVSDLPTGAGVPIGNVGHVADLKFADDVVVLADSVDGLRRTLARIERWCARNGMSLGAAKCGAMVAGAGVDRRAARAKARLAAEPLRLSSTREVIPLVDSYKYLGVLFTENRALEASVAARVRVATHALARLRPLLRDRRVPLEQRLRAIKAYLLPVAQYGCELLGMNEHRLLPLRYVVDAALRECFGARSRASAPVAAMYAEARIAPLPVYAAGARARASRKWRASATWAAQLVTAPVERPPGAPRQATWAEVTWRWLHRVADAAHVPGPVAPGAAAAADEGDEEDPRGRRLQLAVVRYELARLSRAAEGVANHCYERYALEATATEQRDLQRLSGWCGVPWATAVAVSLRLRAFAATSSRRCWSGRAPPAGFEHACPLCHGRAEDLEHFLVECPRWSAARARFLVPVWKRARVLSWVSVPGRRRDVAYILLGGRVGSRRAASAVGRGGAGVGEQRVPVGAGSVNWLVSLSRFIAVVWPLRQAAVRLLSLSHFGGRAAPGGA